MYVYIYLYIRIIHIHIHIYIYINNRGPLALLRTTCTLVYTCVRVLKRQDRFEIRCVYRFSDRKGLVVVSLGVVFFFVGNQDLGGGSRKTKDLRRLPRGVRAGGLPASVHSSAGGRRGLPRWRVRGSGGGDDVGL